MKVINLNKGKYALVDDEDYHRIINYKNCKWFYHTEYAMATIYDEQKRTHTINMHRIIMNAQKGQQVDHINGNRLDNRKENLRFVTNSQNQMNRKKVGAKSGYKGVYWQPGLSKWFAGIYVNGKSKHLGYFIDKVEAAKRYNQAAIEYFGEYASLNQI